MIVLGLDLTPPQLARLEDVRLRRRLGLAARGRNSPARRIDQTLFALSESLLRREAAGCSPGLAARAVRAGRLALARSRYAHPDEQLGGPFAAFALARVVAAARVEKAAYGLVKGGRLRRRWPSGGRPSRR